MLSAFSVRPSAALVVSLFSALLMACSQESARAPQAVMTGPAPTAAGCPNTEYPDWASSPYVLPYPVGAAYTVDLSHCSGSYHSEGEPDAYAIDFDMPIGTLITAVRSGQVVFVEESGVDYNFPNNLVVVAHGDGTFAQYMHLTLNGAFVEEGQTVMPGDAIGSSGATGLAGYPHLHYVETQGRWRYPYESIPTTFRNTQPNERSLTSNYAYRAEPY